MNYKLYLTGGMIRDEFLGLKSKDYDYSVVIENKEDYSDSLDAFYKFESMIKEEGYEIFLSTPSCFTIRAKFPKRHKQGNLTADFVLARKEVIYMPGTRTPKVVLGTLKDDLLRRDFTVNAMAKDMHGNLIDYFGGQEDLINKLLRTPTDTAISFNNDPLRIIRGIRFYITKGLEFSDDIWRFIDCFDADKMDVVSVERIREELYKCFRFDTRKTIELLKTISLGNYPLYLKMLPESMWLEPTLKDK